MAQLLILGLLVAPIPAALTFQEYGTPHALRSVIMLPFLFAISAFGWKQLAYWGTGGRAVTLIATLLLAGQAIFWTVDFFLWYPQRSLAWFDAGRLPAVVYAYDHRGSGRLFLSANLNQPYIFALYAIRPDPRVGLDALGIEQASPQEIAARARPGDLAVFQPYDPRPDGAVPIIIEPTGVGA